MRVWPGLDVDTHVRLRGIDAAELHARCADELAKAQAARAALQAMLDQGGVTVARVGIDKYGGRVDAVVATRGTADVSAAMLRGGFARAYDGRKRGSWCDVNLRHLVTTTGVPTLTRPNRSVTSALYMRIQPCETKPPIRFG